MPVVALALMPPIVQIVGKGAEARWFHEPVDGLPLPQGELWTLAEVRLGSKLVKGYTSERVVCIPLAWRARWVDDDGAAYPWDARPKAVKALSRVHVLAWVAGWGLAQITARGTVTSGLLAAMTTAERLTYRDAVMQSLDLRLVERAATGNEAPTEIVHKVRTSAPPEALEKIATFLGARGGADAIAAWAAGWTSG